MLNAWFGLVPPKGSELEPIFVAMPASRANRALKGTIFQQLKRALPRAPLQSIEIWHASAMLLSHASVEKRSHDCHKLLGTQPEKKMIPCKATISLKKHFCK